MTQRNKGLNMTVRFRGGGGSFAKANSPLAKNHSLLVGDNCMCSVAKLALADGAVGLYQLNGHVTASVGLDLQLTGTAVYGPGPTPDELAFFFDGATTLSQIRDADLAITGALTLEFLVNPSKIPGANTHLVGFTNDGADSEVRNAQWSINLADENTVTFIQESGAGTDAGIGTTFVCPVGDWTHVTVTRASDGNTILVYLNGVQVATVVTEETPSGGSVAQLFIGQVGAADDPFTGMMSSILVVAATRSATTVLADAKRALPGDQCDISLHVSDGALYLAHLNGNLADSLGGSDFEIGTGTERYGPASKRDALAFYFDGSTRLQLEEAQGSLLLLAALTIEVLINPSVIHGSSGTVVSWSNDAPDTEARNAVYQIFLAPGNIISYFHENGSGTNNLWNSNIAAPVGEWTHVAITRAADGVTMILYVNGIPVDSNTMANAPTGGGDGNLFQGTIGASDLDPYTGLMSGLMIYNETRTAAQVLADAQTTLRAGQRPPN